MFTKGHRIAVAFFVCEYFYGYHNLIPYTAHHKRMTIKKCRFHAVIWDLDGTLADSADDLATAVNRVLSETQHPPLPVERIKKMIGHGASKLLQRAFDAVNGLEDFNQQQAYDRFLTHYKLCCCDSTRLYPGVIDVLEHLKSLGIKQGICTNKPQAMTTQILDHLAISHYFEAIVGGDTTPFRKPDPAPLKECLRMLDSHIPDTIMVGDSAADVGAAKALNMTVAVLPWGYSHCDINELAADYVLHDATDLLALI